MGEEKGKGQISVKELQLAQFLWNKFSNVLTEMEIEKEASFFPFQEIKKLMEVKIPDIVYSDTREISKLLYDLNEQLAESRVLIHRQHQERATDPSLIKKGTQWNSNRQMKKKLNKIKEEVEKMAMKRESSPPRSISMNRYTYPKNNVSKLIGFDKQVEEIEKTLLGGGGGFTTIGIVGMGGSGKTALAQHVYKKVREEFSRLIWVCISDTIPPREGKEKEAFRANIVKDMLMELGEDPDESDSWPMDLGTEELLKKLKCALQNERYLIVLDDVWHVDEFYTDLEDNLNKKSEKYDHLSHGLVTDRGGTIIVTSRLEYVAKGIMGGGEKKNLFRLNPGTLSPEQCWEIFENSMEEDYEIEEDDHILIEMKKELTEEFHGLPSAAKALAKIMAKRIKQSITAGVDI